MDFMQATHRFADALPIRKDSFSEAIFFDLYQTSAQCAMAFRMTPPCKTVHDRHRTALIVINEIMFVRARLRRTQNPAPRAMEHRRVPDAGRPGLSPITV